MVPRAGISKPVPSSNTAMPANAEAEPSLESSRPSSTVPSARARPSAPRSAPFAFHVRLGGRAMVEQGIGMDAGEVLTLLCGEAARRNHGKIGPTKGGGRSWGLPSQFARRVY